MIPRTSHTACRGGGVVGGWHPGLRPVLRGGGGGMATGKRERCDHIQPVDTILLHCQTIDNREQARVAVWRGVMVRGGGVGVQGSWEPSAPLYPVSAIFSCSSTLVEDRLDVAVAREAGDLGVERPPALAAAQAGGVPAAVHRQQVVAVSDAQAAAGARHRPLVVGGRRLPLRFGPQCRLLHRWLVPVMAARVDGAAAAPATHHHHLPTTYTSSTVYQLSPQNIHAIHNLPTISTYHTHNPQSTNYFHRTCTSSTIYQLPSKNIHVVTPFANHRLATYSPASRPAKTEPLAACSSQSGNRLAPRASGSQSEIGYAHIYTLKARISDKAVVDWQTKQINWEHRPPPTKVNRVLFLAGLSRIFSRGTRSGRCRWLAGFLGGLPLPSPLHSGAAPYSPRFTLIVSRDPDHDGNTTRLARRSDEALGVLVSVARIAPSLRDLGRAVAHLLVAVLLLLLDGVLQPELLVLLLHRLLLLLRPVSTSPMDDESHECTGRLGERSRDGSYAERSSTVLLTLNSTMMTNTSKTTDQKFRRKVDILNAERHRTIVRPYYQSRLLPRRSGFYSRRGRSRIFECPARRMPLACEFSRGSPVSPILAFRLCSILASPSALNTSLLRADKARLRYRAHRSLGRRPRAVSKGGQNFYLSYTAAGKVKFVGKTGRVLEQGWNSPREDKHRAPSGGNKKNYIHDELRRGVQLSVISASSFLPRSTHDAPRGYFFPAPPPQKRSFASVVPTKKRRALHRQIVDYAAESRPLVSLWRMCQHHAPTRRCHSFLALN
ncbi:hypothetical protein PR048_010145 [Dryococelus australis]|uniref:Ribosomal protein L2 n=1 Tax=Dryococelus australis TaxID=614101 RepID=A0ABQ9I1X2_9NEOP|nr:hypothetical protein PR048_010145 [Dryococelus australis]